MNIWMLNHYAHPPDSPGGTRHYDFARELTKRRHKVTIFASGFSHRTRKEERLKGKQNHRRQKIDGVEFIWVKTFPYYKGNNWRRALNMLSYGWRVIPAALRLKERPDIVLASLPHPFAGLAGWLLSKLKRASFILEVRDLWPQTFVEVAGYSNKSLTVRLMRLLEKFLYRRARKIIVLLPEASEYITGRGIPANKIVYIPNGVSPELFSGATAKLPERLDKLISELKSGGTAIVGYTGAHGIADALDTIVEAAKLLQEQGVDKIHFLLVGEGPEKKGLMEKADRLGLTNLSFFEPIPKNAMSKLLRAIDMAVVSLRKSGMWRYGTSKNKLFDYMMCARPIVWAINSANDPVAEAGCGISVAPEEPEAMTKAITQLYNISEQERQEMGMRGYQYTVKYHSIPILADKLLEVMAEAKQR
jgi:glycosyltransferase involved in cell wall biosynthesis